MYELKEYVPLKQGLRHLGNVQRISCPSQRVCSTKTRIKTLSLLFLNLILYPLKEYVPLKQGLFQFSDNLYFYQKAIRLYLFYAIK